jgi:hypothetical protein
VNGESEEQRPSPDVKPCKILIFSSRDIIIEAFVTMEIDEIHLTRRRAREVKKKLRCRDLAWEEKKDERVAKLKARIFRLSSCSPLYSPLKARKTLKQRRLSSRKAFNLLAKSSSPVADPPH